MDPVKVEVSTKFQTPKALIQNYLFIPAKWKDCYLAYMLDEFQGQSSIIFVATCNNALRVALLLRNLGFKAVCLHGLCIHIILYTVYLNTYTLHI